jgi:hypothetical protein
MPHYELLQKPTGKKPAKSLSGIIAINVIKTIVKK